MPNHRRAGWSGSLGMGRVLSQVLRAIASISTPRRELPFRTVCGRAGGLLLPPRPEDVPLPFQVPPVVRKDGPAPLQASQMACPLSCSKAVMTVFRSQPTKQWTSKPPPGRSDTTREAELRFSPLPWQKPRRRHPPLLSSRLPSRAAAISVAVGPVYSRMGFAPIVGWGGTGTCQ